jgi:hypothetical protein
VTVQSVADFKSRRLCSKRCPWSEALAGCKPWHLITMISLRLRHIDSGGAEVQSGRTFVTMILQECVFGLGAFWGRLAAMERLPVLL